MYSSISTRKLCFTSMYQYFLLFVTFKLQLPDTKLPGSPIIQRPTTQIPTNQQPITRITATRYTTTRPASNYPINNGCSCQVQSDECTADSPPPNAGGIACSYINDFFPRGCLQPVSQLSGVSFVHSDLATRNVLLDRDRRAKICDFGLSRRLYDYSSYVKSKSEPLPWRWMSPESLRRMQFNEKSDVWAFGVTVWEIFSFGDVPYPGLSWTNDFAMRLEAGLCLQRPSNCPQDLYDKMLQCWNVSPLSRPTFAQLKTEFAENVGN